MIIETTEDRIEGFCNLKGWRGRQSVISISRINGKIKSKWHTSSSMCLPSDIEDAKNVVACYKEAFDVLDKIK